MKISIRVWSLAAIAAVTLTATACSDPEVAKRRFLEKGDAHAAKGEHRQAVLEYRNAVKIDPRFGEARFKLAESLAATDRADSAVKEYIRAAELLPDRADVQIRAATVYLVAREFETARKHAEAALTAEPRNASAHILLANSLAGLNDLPAAIEQIEEAIELAPDDARAHANLGVLRQVEGNREQALAAYQKAVEVEPQSVDARLALGYFYWQTRSLDEAEKTLNEAVALDETHQLANRMLAVFYASAGRAAQAEAPLLRLANAGDANAKTALADLYLHTGREQDARALLEELSQAKESRVAAVTRLARVDFARGNRDAAYARLDEGLAASSNDPDLLVLKARFLVADDRLQEAEDAAQQATTSRDSAVARYVLGLAQQAAGKRQEATQSFNETLRLNPRAFMAEVQLSRLMLASGKVDEALTFAESARKAQPGNADARLATALALLGKRDLVKADAEIRTLLRDYPKVAAVHALHGGLLAMRSDAGGSARAFDRALELDPSNLQALRGRIAIDLQQKRVADARTRVERALTAQPNNAKVLVLAGTFEGATGHTEAAERHLRRAIDLEPHSIDAYGLLARVYLSQRKLDPARQELEEIAKRATDPLPAKTMIGIIFDTQNRPADAIKVYEDIVANTSRAPVAANNLAWRYAERRENLDRALELAQSAKSQLPDRHEVDHTLGWVYYQKDMPELAISSLLNSVKRDETNATYHLHLGLAYAKAGRKAEAIRTLERALAISNDFAGADQARSTLVTLKS